MAINIKFDLTGNPEPPTIILANRNGNKLGQLKVNEDSIDLSDKFNDASEISFTVNKYVDGELVPLWDKLADFKLIWCKEWDLWFEIKVELDEETETVKTVFCTQLGQAELSQIMLYNIEINTEKDIERDDYKISILWDENNPRASILDRLLEKAPHYSIIHVDDTIKNIQRSFSFDSTSIKDAFDEIAEEIGCLFVYHSNSGENGKIQRTISVYDLQQNCLNQECKYRGEFTDRCPKCGGTDINYNEDVFKDTLIFVTADQLASQGIQLVTDTDSVKNCFKLEGGDDLMTATIRNCNPNGTDYLWYFSDAVKEDMSKELVNGIESYNVLYKEYYNDHISELNTDLVNQYNNLVEKYEGFYNTKSSCINCKHEEYFDDICPNCGSKNILSGKKLQTIPAAIKGYSSLMNAYYNTIDLALYLQSGLMPSIQMSKTTAKEQAELLLSDFPSTIATNNKEIKAISKSTADSAALSMAKIIVKSTYKVEIEDSTYDENNYTWTGNFVITNYSDDTDKYPKLDTDEKVAITVDVNNDTETFVKQKMEKTLNKEDTEDYSVSGLFKFKEIENDDSQIFEFEKTLNLEVIDGKNIYSGTFYDELKKYALNPLKSFYEACDACLNVLIDDGYGSALTEEDLKNNKPDIYNNLYLPYRDRASAIGEEIKVREKEIAVIEGVWDKTDENNPKLETEGLQYYIGKCRNEIQDALNFEKYLNNIKEDLWLEFCAYRREDTYSNDNYVSDGLDNTELFKRALEFIEVAQNEIYKSAELQHSISTSLNNLLAIDKFEPLVDSFRVGNWIRVQVDDKIFKLRLLEYEIDFGSFENISVEFSDVTKVKNGVTDVKSVIDQASSMATNYSSIQRQAKQGNDAKSTVNQWLEKGLNSADVRIKSNNNEEVAFGKNGLLCRSYDDVANDYSPEQFRLTHNIMAYTNDNWNTVSTALGKHNYVYYNANKLLQEDVDYGLSAKFVTAGYVNGSQIIGGEIFSQNYTSTTGTYMDLNNGTFSWAGGKIKYDGDNVTLNGVSLTWSDIGDAPTKVSAFENDADYKNGDQVTQITKDTVTTKYVNALKVTADSVAAEKITGTTISGKTISGGSINIGDGKFTVTSDGKMTTKSGEIGGNLSISGSLTHTRGNYTVTLRGVQSTVTNGVFYITDKSSGSNVYPFLVGGDGSLRATKATITGTIHAKDGTIANWDINDNTISKATTIDGTKVVTGMQQPDNGSYAFFAGTYNGSNYSGCEFKVTHTGKLYASGANISGDSTFSGSLSGADGTFKGKLSAVSGTFTSLTAGKSNFTEKQVKISTPSTKDAEGSIYIGASGVEGWEDITIRPSSDNLGNIGTSGKSWDMLYVKNGAIHSSDRNCKTDILKMGEKQERLFNLLSPVTFKFIDSSHDRYHYGFISQEVEDAINECGLTTKDFAGFCKDVKRNDNGEIIFDDNGNQEYVYSLRYTEFIALNTHMIQKVQAENQKLKERIDSLEEMIKRLS